MKQCDLGWFMCKMFTQRTISFKKFEIFVAMIKFNVAVSHIQVGYSGDSVELVSFQRMLAGSTSAFHSCTSGVHHFRFRCLGM